MAGLFDTSQWQGWPSFGTLGNDFYENQPSAAYQRLLNQMGLGAGAQSPFAKYAQGQRDDAYNSYLAKLGGMANGGGMGDPTQYSYVDFLQEYGPTLNSSFANLTPSQRGEKFGGGAPRARWIGWPA